MRIIKNNKKIKPPRLLRGLFIAILLTIFLILAFTWSIINDDIEQLVKNRTSEYAHSIAQIAANSAADPLMADDKLQLNMLVENVARDLYIKNATIFSENGQIAAEFPFSRAKVRASLTNGLDDDILTANESSTKERTFQYLQSKKDLPFVEAIHYQGVTAGWFKLVIDSQKLESSFRESLRRSRHVILVFSVLFLTALFIFIWRIERSVRNLVRHNHRLIQINSVELPENKTEWMDKIRELSTLNLIHLTKNKQLPAPESPWISSRRKEGVIFCYCQFSMPQQEDEKSAQCLTLAEHYLQTAIQSHGVKSQGDILSGCIIPFIQNKQPKEALHEAFALCQLINDLLADLPLTITMRAFIGIGTILVLENNRAEISGISLSNRLMDKINKLAPHINYQEVLMVNFEEDELTGLGKFSPLDAPYDINALKLIASNPQIQLQVNRQARFIKSDILRD